MIDSIDNLIQLTVLGACLITAALHAVSSGRREWILLSLFYGSSFAGTLYWVIYLALYYFETPFNSFIADLSWDTSTYFLILLILYIKGRKEPKSLPAPMVLIPLFTAAMCAYYATFGSVFSNIVSMVLMTALMWNTAAGLALIRDGSEKQKRYELFYIACLLFFLNEYALWTASCISSDSPLLNLYYVFDTLLSACYMLFIPAMRKAVGR